MTPIEWVRIAAAFALFGLGAAGLFAPGGYPGIEDPTVASGLAFAFIVAGMGALGIKIPALTNKRNGER